MPELVPLVLVLKHLLRARGLNESYTGGLSSYATTLLAVGFLQVLYRECGRLSVCFEMHDWWNIQQAALQRLKEAQREQKEQQDRVGIIPIGNGEGEGEIPNAPIGKGVYALRYDPRPTMMPTLRPLSCCHEGHEAHRKSTESNSCLNLGERHFAVAVLL